MESKTVKISELLDDYTDNEFFIDEESEVNIDKIKEKVIAKVSGKKTKIKPVAKIMIAAAAAAALTGMVSAAAVHGTMETYSVIAEEKAVQHKTDASADDLTEKLVDEDGNVIEVQEADGDKTQYEETLEIDGYDAGIVTDDSADVTEKLTDEDGNVIEAQKADSEADSSDKTDTFRFENE